MYQKIKGGSSLTIGEDDLSITVHLPPKGYIWNYETERLEESEILSRSSIKSEQFWERPEPPADYKKKVAREKTIQKSDPEYFDSDLQQYRAQEWKRRKYGVWVMIKGQAYYLTGLYYYYLTHWHIGHGYPDFRMADLHKTYFWRYCEEDPFCYGMVEVTQRQVGKTIFSGCMLTEFASRVSNANVGIQSKTNTDGKKVFAKAVVRPFRKLIDFFKPVYDTSQGTAPKNELRFYEASKKGKDVEDSAGEGELESMIDYQNSTEVAYDGQTLHRYLCDEVFKTTEVDIYKRHLIIIPCLTNAVTREIRGKALYTSTVEEMEGHIERYIKFWADSDHLKKGKNGRTKTGLYRYFTPAQSLMYIDRYGFPDRERALQRIQDDLDSITDPRDKADYIRKSPRNWKEAFRSANQECLYDVMKLDERLDVLNWRKQNYDRFVLEWNDDRTEVKKTKSPSGQHMFAWDFEGEDKANNVINRASQFHPKNNIRFVIGIDTFDHNRRQDGTFSNGAAAVYMKFDSLNQENSENFVALYVGRPPTSKQFYEEMIKLAHYFGCKVLHENNKPNMEDYFKERGYGSFLTYDEKGRAGIAGSEKSHIQIVEETEHFILHHCDKVNFPELLNDWKNFELDDTTKYDLAMASGYALIASARIRRKAATISRLSKGVQTNMFFRKYKINSKTKYAKSWNSLVTT